MKFIVNLIDGTVEEIAPVKIAVVDSPEDVNAVRDVLMSLYSKHLRDFNVMPEVAPCHDVEGSMIVNLIMDYNI